MGLLQKINGIIGNLFQLGIGGPQLKNNSGVVEIRDAGDDSYSIIRGGTPVGSDDLVTKAYIDAHPSPYLINVVAAALTNINISSPSWTAANWDGVTPPVGARVLLSQQSTASENGIYIRPVSGSMSRSSDALACGTRVYSEGGEIYTGCSFIQETTGTITFGVSPIIFSCLDGPRLAAPLTTLIASGAGAWTTLLTIPGPGADGYDVVLVIDNVATKSDGYIIARSRGPITYRQASGVLSLSDDSRYLTAATFLQQVISGTNILIQGWQQAAGNGNYTFRIRVWFEYVRCI